MDDESALWAGLEGQMNDSKTENEKRGWAALTYLFVILPPLVPVVVILWRLAVMPW